MPERHTWTLCRHLTCTHKQRQGEHQKEILACHFSIPPYRIEYSVSGQAQGYYPYNPELPGLDREDIRDWYNGYSWLGDEKVYNPFDILLLFDKRTFGTYWFETGTPTFLIETLFNRRVSSLELDNMIGGDELLSTFDVDDMATKALLFQTGYLTITEKENLGGASLYRLGYPNREVRQSLNRSLLRYLEKDSTRLMANTVRMNRHPIWQTLTDPILMAFPGTTAPPPPIVAMFVLYRRSEIPRLKSTSTPGFAAAALFAAA